MQHQLVTITSSAALLMCIISCSKNEDNPIKKEDKPIHCQSQVLQSIIRSVEHGSDLNNLTCFTNVDSIAIIFSRGRISSVTTASSVTVNGIVQTLGISKTEFIFDGNKVYVIYPHSATIHDTLIVDASMHILEQRHFDENAGCASTFSSNWTYHYDAAGTLVQATRHEFSDGIPLSTVTLLYTFANGDLVKCAGSHDNIVYDYYQDKLLPKDFIPYEQIMNGGAFTYRNTHLPASRTPSTGNLKETINYLTDSTGRIVRVVTTSKYDGGAMRMTEQYNYVCQ